MRKAVLVVLAMALVPSCVFAVDGVVLINQSTVMAAGGFPYVISQPGSYKLSGSLTMNTTNTGNYQQGPNRFDVAIVISSSSGVVLDLNGFSIIVNNTDPNLGHGAFAVYSPVISPSQLSIKNGVITINSVPFNNPSGFNAPVGILLLGCTSCAVEDLTVSLVTNSSFGYAVGLGSRSLVRHNRFSAPQQSGIACPSVVVENTGVNQTSLNADGCAAANNVQ